MRTSRAVLRPTLGFALAAAALTLAACGGSDADSSQDADTAATDIVLRGDGLGVAAFGDATEQALAAIEAELEPGTEEGDPVQVEAASYRTVAWGENDLVVTFSDGSQYREDGAEHMVAWRSNGPVATADGEVPLATSEGVTVGDTAASFSAAHPSAVSMKDPCLDLWTLRLDERDNNGERIAAELTLVAVLSSNPSEADSTIEWFQAGSLPC